MPARSKLPRRLSLKGRRDIGETLRYGTPSRGEGFLLRWRPSERSGYVVLVGRRHGNAVRRNRIKRVFREALRLNRHRLQREVQIAVLPAAAQALPRFEIVNAEFGRIFETIAHR